MTESAQSGAGSRCELLRALAEDERREVLASARRRSFGRREVPFHRGDPDDTVHLTVSGTVAVPVTTPTGSMAIFAVFGPGQAVGEMALVEAGERTASAVALELAETLSLRRDQVEELRRRHPHHSDAPALSCLETLAIHLTRISSRLGLCLARREPIGPTQGMRGSCGDRWAVSYRPRIARCAAGRGGPRPIHLRGCWRAMALESVLSPL